MTWHLQKGLTLLELLIAVSILAVIGLASATTLNSALNSEMVVKKRADELEALSYTLSTLRKDLEQVIGRPFNYMSSGSERSQPIIGYHDDISNAGLLLKFTRTGKRTVPGSAPSSRLEHISYYVDEGRLIRASTPLATPLDEVFAARKTLLSGVESVHVFYYANSWIESWSTESQRNYLPRAVRVVLTTARWGEVEQTVLLPESPND